jgi:hypothetical protein
MTAMENCVEEALVPPLLTPTLIEIFEYVPTSPKVGVPESSPVATLKLAHRGQFIIVKVASFPATPPTAGLNEKGSPTKAVSAGEPVMVGVFILVEPLAALLDGLVPVAAAPAA